MNPLSANCPGSSCTADNTNVSALPSSVPGPSQYSAESARTWIRRRLGSSLPPGKNSFIAGDHSSSIFARSSTTRARPATDTYVFLEGEA
ncbi:hypothetical protein G6F65_023300 [Rhizopus arrhizus]|nr:hypothetical protein G6F65_023300 [Rhizopus arrhizus]